MEKHQGDLFILWVSDEGARRFLGLTRPDNEVRRWAFIGEMTPVKELNALGTWMAVLRIEERERGTDAKVIKTWSVTPNLCLVRHDFIILAQHLGKKANTPIGVKS